MTFKLSRGWAAKLPKDLAELSKTGEFYVRAITAEAAVTYFAEIPVKSANGKSYVHAFLGLTAQDIGPVIPIRCLPR